VARACSSRNRSVFNWLYQAPEGSDGNVGGNAYRGN
jgi:hypothetical protein